MRTYSQGDVMRGPRATECPLFKYAAPDTPRTTRCSTSIRTGGHCTWLPATDSLIADSPHIQGSIQNEQRGESRVSTHYLISCAKTAGIKTQSGLQVSVGLQIPDHHSIVNLYMPLYIHTCTLTDRHTYIQSNAKIERGERKRLMQVSDQF